MPPRRVPRDIYQGGSEPGRQAALLDDRCRLSRDHQPSGHFKASPIAFIEDTRPEIQPSNSGDAVSMRTVWSLEPSGRRRGQRAVPSKRAHGGGAWS